MEHGEESILKILLDAIPENEFVTVHKLTCITGLDHRTINKYANLIIEIQQAHKIVKHPKGMRLLLRKHSHYSNAPQFEAIAAPDLMLLKNPAQMEEGD